MLSFARRTYLERTKMIRAACDQAKERRKQLTNLVENIFLPQKAEKVQQLKHLLFDSFVSSLCVFFWVCFFGGETWWAQCATRKQQAAYVVQFYVVSDKKTILDTWNRLKILRDFSFWHLHSISFLTLITNDAPQEK